MSTFSGLNLALTSLVAQRQALEVSGQNIANANTAGYTRQRANMESVQGSGTASLWSTTPTIGGGVVSTSITRMGDLFLDTQMRSATSQSSFQSTRASALGALETLVDEPGDGGFAAALATYWADWQDVANTPDDTAARSVLLGDARALVSQVSDGYRAVRTQWGQTRSTVDALVTEVNTIATSVADLNNEIRAITVSGGNANELIDRRSTMITELSSLIGATASQKPDGTMSVLVGGNPLVSGDRSRALEVQGSTTMAGGLGEPPAALDQVRLGWSDGGPLVPEGGRIAAHLTDLAPGGSYQLAAKAWNDVATSLATSVNAVHTTGQTLGSPPAPGGAFFAVAAGLPAALGISVAITDPRDVAAADPTKGVKDGSVADAMSLLAGTAGGPDERWASYVVDLGVRANAATQRSAVLESARANAETLQLSSASVDVDEESVNMLAYQRAYEGAARVITVMDEMLDVLINRTGTVGR